MEWLVIISLLLWGILVLFIFLKSQYDNKKEQSVLTELYLKYGVKTAAQIVSFREHKTYGRNIPGKYEMWVEIQYHSPNRGEIPTVVHLWTNNDACKEYKGTIPVLFIPQYVDFLDEKINKRELLEQLGCRINIYAAKMLMFHDDISTYTNMRDF